MNNARDTYRKMRDEDPILQELLNTDEPMKFSLLGGTEEQREFLYEQLEGKVFDEPIKFVIARPDAADEKREAKPVSQIELIDYGPNATGMGTIKPPKPVFTDEQIFCEPCGISHPLPLHHF